MYQAHKAVFSSIMQQGSFLTGHTHSPYISPSRFPAIREFLWDPIEKQMVSSWITIIATRDFFLQNQPYLCWETLVGISLLVHITNSANCTNYTKTLLLARVAFILFLNRLHSTMSINYTCLSIHNHQIIHSIPHTICIWNPLKAAGHFWAVLYSCIAHPLQ